MDQDSGACERWETQVRSPENPAPRVSHSLQLAMYGGGMGGVSSSDASEAEDDEREEEDCCSESVAETVPAGMMAMRVMGVRVS